MKNGKTKYYLFSLAIFLLAVSLRLGLSLVNREANDPHIKVIRLILQTDRLPTKGHCGECFQPKLFHYLVARVILHVDHGIFKTDRDTQILIGQIINLLAGLVTLVIAWMFIERLPFQNRKAKLFAFALAALNPKMIGINSQVTNDAFLILFSTSAIYCIFHFLRKQTTWILLPAMLFTVLAISSKSSGWVTALAILLAMLTKSWIEKEGRLRILSLAAAQFIAVVALTFLNPLSQYLTNLQQYGAPILANIEERRPFPNVFSKTYYSDSGIVSIQDGFFTFKFIELIKRPRIDRKDWTDQLYRTSLWTLLYGRAHSVHFDNWPISWSTSSDQGFLLSRSIFVLALIPTVLILFGVITQIVFMFKNFFHPDNPIMKQTYFGLFLLALSGYVGFVIVFSILDQGYQVIKAIFIFPAFLSFIFFFLQGSESLNLLLSKRGRWSVFLVDASIVILLILYAMDIYTLIAQLYRAY